MWVYVSLFFFESFTLYLYYYGWERWHEGRAKLMHWSLGILLNIWGTAVMFIANSWLTFMTSPRQSSYPTRLQKWCDSGALSRTLPGCRSTSTA